MQFNHYGGEASRLAADLVNTRWPCTSGVIARLLTGRGVVVGSVSEEQVSAMQEWSRDLAECFGSTSVQECCRVINQLLARTASQPRISLHDGTPHLHYSRQESDLVAHVQAMTSTGLAYVACFSSTRRLGRCARLSCRLAFVDSSRNGRRNYCSARCGNTEAVSRHRRSKYAGGTP